MKKDIAEKWIAELRSGKYEQGKDFLNKGDKYCCLGVLCEIALAESVCAKKPGSEDDGNTYDEWELHIPSSVKNWSGMKDHDGSYVSGENLAKLNDSGKTFFEIADIIEANIENL